MLILLPPSETKRAGGAARPLALDRLALPALAPERRRVIDALVALSSDAANATRVLKLGRAAADDIAANAALWHGPTMPAIDRYTGVLFDALGAASLDAASRRWLGNHVLVHSAPFGPVGALDRIPAYRLAAGASVPGLGSLRALWAEPVTAELARGRSFVLDLRSEAYAALGPVPGSRPSAYVRVVADEAGRTRALNHFNKHAKGALVRALATTRPALRGRSELIAWAGSLGIHMREADGEVQLLAG